MSATGDLDAVARIRAGDRAAFDLIVLRHGKPLRAFIRNRLRALGDADVEDLAQEAMLSAYVRILESDRPMHVRGWLYRCAANACIDELRRPRHVETQDGMRTAGSDPVEVRDELRTVLVAVGALPRQQARALLIQAIGGRSNDAIAGELALSVSAVKSLIHRGRGQLRADLGLADAA